MAIYKENEAKKTLEWNTSISKRHFVLKRFGCCCSLSFKMLQFEEVQRMNKIVVSKRRKKKNKTKQKIDGNRGKLKKGYFSARVRNTPFKRGQKFPPLGKNYFRVGWVIVLNELESMMRNERTYRCCVNRDGHGDVDVDVLRIKWWWWWWWWRWRCW